LAQPAAAPAQLAQTDPSDHLFKLGFKFLGANSCAGAKCHGAPIGAAPAAGGAYVNPSFTLWNADATPDAPADPHRNSFKTLRSPNSTKISQALGIASPLTDASCLSCHALNVPANLRGEGFQIAEGVTCNACHGPAGASLTDASWKGWNEAHQKPEWRKKTEAAAQAGQSEDLLKKTGFYDTHPLVERSQQCVSCHLAISPKMVAAGHKQPTFEMHWFSVTYPNRHWTDPTDKYFGAKLWAAGQAAALQASLRQLAERGDPKSGATPADLNVAYAQALAHYTIFAPLFSAGGVQGDIATIAAQLGAAQKGIADPAKRAEVTKGASAAVAAADKLTPVVDKWQPSKAVLTKILAAELAQPQFLSNLSSGFGIEQQRDTIFALYKAIADTDKEAGAEDNVNFIGQKLFPLDDKGAPIVASKVPAAQHNAAVAEVKGKLKM
jgi:hypothetical protein